MDETNSTATNTASQDEVQAIQAQVNDLIKQVTVDNNGKYVYPEGTPPHLKLLVAAEKKFRDTQAGYTQSRQELKGLEAEVTVLREQVAKTSALTGLSKAERDELEELKFSDPDSWHAKISELEKSHKSSLDTKLSEVKTQYSAQVELERRVGVLAEFNNMHGVSITEEVLTNDIPPRIQNKLANGVITFEQFLTEAHEYLGTKKVVKNPKEDDTTNLNSLGGGKTPPKADKSMEIDYSKAVF